MGTFPAQALFGGHPSRFLNGCHVLGFQAFQPGTKGEPRFATKTKGATKMSMSSGGNGWMDGASNGLDPNLRVSFSRGSHYRTTTSEGPSTHLDTLQPSQQRLRPPRFCLFVLFFNSVWSDIRYFFSNLTRFPLDFGTGTDSAIFAATCCGTSFTPCPPRRVGIQGWLLGPESNATRWWACTALGFFA